MTKRNVVERSNKIVNLIYWGYLLLFFLFFVLNSTRFPQFSIASEQLLMWGLSFVFTLVTLKKGANAISFAVFIFQLISIFYVRSVNINLFGDPLGFDPHDALFYRECGESFGGGDIRTFFVWLVASYGSLDDWGFPLIVWGVYSLFGKVGDIVLLLLNVFFITFGSKSLYKLSNFFISKDSSTLISLFWGLSPFAVCTAAGGLKENFFAFFVIRFFFNLISYKKGNKDRFLLIAIDLFGIFLFRLSVGYAGILCLFFYFLLRSSAIRKNIKSLLVITIAIGGLVFPVVLNQIAGQRGLSAESVLASSSNKAENVGGAVGYAVNTAAALIGPFPTFASGDEEKINYITRYSFTLYLKLILSFFFFYALGVAVKKKSVMTYPLFFFVFVNMLMLIIAFFALNVRFHWPHIPLFFMLAAYGLEEYKKNVKTQGILVGYLLIGFMIVFLYNIR